MSLFNQLPQKHLLLFVRGYVLLIVIFTVDELLQQRNPLAYAAMFPELPPWALTLRYFASVARRIVMVVAAGGVLIKDDLSRKVLIAISAFNMLTVYWRHPYSAFENISRYLGTNAEDFTRTATFLGQSFYPGVLMRMLSSYMIDICLFGTLILILMHPRVKQMYKEKV